MRLHRNSIWLLPLLIVITYPLWSVPVGDFLTPRGGFDHNVKARKGQGRNFNMDSVKILQNEDGRKTAVIRAAHAQTGETAFTLLMDIVNADLYDEDGNITNIVASHGEYNTRTKILTLTDEVVVHKIKDKQFLYTNLLHYHSGKRTINCPGKTRLEGEDVIIDGGSLNYDIKSKSYVIANRVQCLLNGFATP